MCSRPNVWFDRSMHLKRARLMECPAVSVHILHHQPLSEVLYLEIMAPKKAVKVENEKRQLCLKNFMGERAS